MNEIVPRDATVELIAAVKRRLPDWTSTPSEAEIETAAREREAAIRPIELELTAATLSKLNSADRRLVGSLVPTASEANASLEFAGWEQLAPEQLREAMKQRVLVSERFELARLRRLRQALRSSGRDVSVVEELFQATRMRVAMLASAQERGANGG